MSNTETHARTHVHRTIRAALAAAVLAAGTLATLATARPASAATIPSVSISDITVTEGNGPAFTLANLNVTLSAPTTSIVDVDITFDSFGSTATRNVDWLGNETTLRFNPGVTGQNLQLLVIGDTVNEQDETIGVNVIPRNGTSVAGDNRGVVTIRDDDRPVVVRPGIPAASVTEGNIGSNPVMTFAVQLDRAPTSPASLSFTTSRFGGSNPAQPGVDFVETSGILRFAAGQRTAFINVTTIGDNTREATERVIVRLSNPLNLQFPGTISGTPGLFLHGDLVNND